MCSLIHYERVKYNKNKSSFFIWYNNNDDDDDDDNNKDKFIKFSYVTFFLILCPSSGIA